MTRPSPHPHSACPPSSVIVTGDDVGVVAQWAVPSAGSASAPALIARHDKGGGAPVTSVGIVLGAALVAAYADGFIRVFAAGGSLAVEVVAHARAVGALATQAAVPTFASVGDDGVVNVWTLPELAARRGGGGSGSSGSAGGGSAGGTGVGPLVLTMSSKAAAIHCGAAFFAPAAAPAAVLAVAAYDTRALLVFKDL
jgi:hypothetical protein